MRFTMLSAAAAVLTLAACAETNPVTNKAPGTYRASAESTNTAGTTTKTKQTTNVYNKAGGDKEAIVKTETTTDPKGLFNKEKTTTYKKYE